MYSSRPVSGSLLANQLIILHYSLVTVTVLCFALLSALLLIERALLKLEIVRLTRHLEKYPLGLEILRRSSSG
jgi:hypothetical protein